MKGLADRRRLEAEVSLRAVCRDSAEFEEARARCRALARATGVNYAEALRGSAERIARARP